jgi:hypothetical protein
MPRQEYFQLGILPRPHKIPLGCWLNKLWDPKMDASSDPALTTHSALTALKSAHPFERIFGYLL